MLGPHVFLVRHGETEWSLAGRSTGTSDIELTPAGASGVSNVATALIGAGNLIDPSRINTIFVSPRKRATQTLTILLNSFGRSASDQIICTEDVAEWNYGLYEGLTKEEIRGRRKERGLDKVRKWDILQDGCEGEITRRLDALIKQIKEIQRPYMYKEQPADILIVGHGLLHRCLLKRWLDIPIDFPLPMVYDPVEIMTLCYKNQNIDEPAFHPGVSLPYERRGET